ncbi:MAG: hypothetical protein J6Y74_02150 [Clostridia bacterium]|nr:hypothetical protein [Clostridia bacterium]
MKTYLIGLAAVIVSLVLICFFGDVSFVPAFEEQATVSLGIARERRFPEIDFEQAFVRAETPSEVKNEELSEPKEVPEAEPSEESSFKEEAPFESVFTADGHYQADLRGGFDEDLIRRVEEKVGSQAGENYILFSAQGKMTPLADPLDERELSYVLSEMIVSYTSSLPIKGKLAEVSIDKNGDCLVGKIRVEVRFEELAEKYHMDSVPTEALFCLTIPIEVGNSEISVISEEIELKSESRSIPDVLLIFGCNAVFGKQNHRAIFAGVVKNVLVNAGIYR